MDYSFKGIGKFAIPVMFSSFAEFAITFADTAFLGHIGSYEINLAGTSGLIHLCYLMFILGFSFGGQIVVSRLKGKDEKRSRQILIPILIPLLTLALIGWGIFTFVSPNAYTYLIDDDKLAAGLAQFLKLRSWGFFPAAITIGLTAFLLGQGNSKPLIWTTILITSANIILDYCFIYGVGVEAMGVFGAPIASVIAETIGMLCILFLSFRIFGKTIFQKTKSFWKEVQQICWIGSPLMFQKFMSLGAWTAFFLAVEKLGTHELAVSQLIRSLYYLTLIPVISLGTVTKSYISFYAENGRDKLVAVKNKLLIFSLLLTFIFVHGFIFYPGVFLQLLTTDLQLIQDAKPIIRSLVGAMMLFSFGHISFTTIEGLGHTKWASFIELASISFYLVIVYFLVQIPGIKLFSVWMVDYLYFAFIALLSFVLLKFYFQWKPKHIS